MEHTMQVIARIRSEFPTKFGIPRQSGLVPETRATIVFEPEYRNPDALRGLEGFSHLWLIWEFAYGAPAASGRQCAPRRFCHALAFPPEPHRSFLRSAGKDLPDGGSRDGPARFRGRPDGRHAYF